MPCFHVKIIHLPHNPDEPELKNFKSRKKIFALQTPHIKVFPDLRKNILPGNGRISRQSNFFCIKMRILEL